MLSILAIVLLAGGAVLVFLGWRELVSSRIFLGRPTSPTRELRPGPVEVAGVIRADGEAPVRSALGTECVIVHTIVEQRVGKNKFREDARETHAVRSVVSDDSGSCAVSLAHVDLMGEMWEITELAGRRVTQIIVPEGSRVLVAGIAREGERATQGDYRASSLRLSVSGSHDAPLLLSIGSQAGAVWRYGWRALLAIGCGALLMMLAGAAGFLHAAL